MDNKDILELKIDNDDFPEDLTIGGYLNLLIFTLWAESEGFSGKRPFGNSGWEYDLVIPLLKAGLIDGKLDEDGDVDYIDFKAGHKIISNLIKDMDK